MSNQALAPEQPPREAEAFLERVAGIIDAGAQSVMISIGHRTGLFDVMAGLPPATSAEIAAAAELAERYVREWLAVMVTARIVEYDPKRALYRLPPEHAACLTRGAALGNLAVYAQMIPLIGAAQERVLECFETGEGTAYADYPCMHQVMAEDSGQTVVEPLFGSILPLVEGIEERLRDGIDVLDAGCGRGRALLALAERFPASRFVGYDLCADAIEHARNDARRRDLGNVRFEARDLTGFDEPGRFDFVMSFDAVHDQKDPQGLLRGLYRSLKPGGAHLMQDIGGSAHLENNLEFPMASLLYAISCAHCTPISIGQGGAGLGTMWGW
ncbi:MAG: class I SAM-dependent methyltransferase, partial [Gammaproteobacteria bacterium]|nr:class I SAM-dependent methyltransferase [Gammaproteobacteria bacterium]